MEYVFVEISPFEIKGMIRMTRLIRLEPRGSELARGRTIDASFETVPFDAMKKQCKLRAASAASFESYLKR